MATDETVTLAPTMLSVTHALAIVVLLLLEDEICCLHVIEAIIGLSSHCVGRKTWGLKEEKGKIVDGMFTFQEICK
jgi:hypothetical protein